MAQLPNRPYDGRSLYEALRPLARWNLSPEELTAEALHHGEGVLTHAGALAVRTGEYTGRSPRDKFTVRREPSAARIDWTSKFNLPLDPERAELLVARFVEKAKALRVALPFPPAPFPLPLPLPLPLPPFRVDSLPAVALGSALTSVPN